MNRQLLLATFVSLLCLAPAWAQAARHGQQAVQVTVTRDYGPAVRPQDPADYDHDRNYSDRRDWRDQRRHEIRRERWDRRRLGDRYYRWDERRYPRYQQQVVIVDRDQRDFRLALFPPPLILLPPFFWH